MICSKHVTTQVLQQTCKYTGVAANMCIHMNKCHDNIVCSWHQYSCLLLHMHGQILSYQALQQICQSSFQTLSCVRDHHSCLCQDLFLQYAAQPRDQMQCTHSHEWSCIALTACLMSEGSPPAAFIRDTRSVSVCSSFLYITTSFARRLTLPVLILSWRFASDIVPGFAKTKL